MIERNVHCVMVEPIVSAERCATCDKSAHNIARCSVHERCSTTVIKLPGIGPRIQQQPHTVGISPLGRREQGDLKAVRGSRWYIQLLNFGDGFFAESELLRKSLPLDAIPRNEPLMLSSRELAVPLRIRVRADLKQNAQAVSIAGSSGIRNEARTGRPNEIQWSPGLKQGI